MRIPKSPELPIPPPSVPSCCCRGAFVVRGRKYVGTDPGCPEHGFDAFTREKAEYETQEPREVTGWKGRK
jgi:hypothetical protein